jgi:hypothetical protein
MSVPKEFRRQVAAELGFEPCTDGNCVWGHPGGMHTNGGCKCLLDTFVDRGPYPRVRFRTMWEEYLQLRWWVRGAAPNAE